MHRLCLIVSHFIFVAVWKIGHNFMSYSGNPDFAVLIGERSVSNVVSLWPSGSTRGRLVHCHSVKSWVGIAASDHWVTAIARFPLQDQTKRPSDLFTPWFQLHFFFSLMLRHNKSVLKWSSVWISGDFIVKDCLTRTKKRINFHCRNRT